MDKARLFKCVEVAEAAVLVRLEAIRKDSDHHAEREAIADALNHLELLKNPDWALIEGKETLPTTCPGTFSFRLKV